MLFGQLGILILFFCILLFSTFTLSLFDFSSRENPSSYECGFEPIGSSHLPFCMKFFLLAILFIVFDVEVCFLVPALFCSALIFSFAIILILGLIYEFAYGSLS